MPASPRSVLSVLVLFLVLASHQGAAQADSLDSTYGGALEERAHRVTIELSSTDLLMRVRRDIRNTGERVEEATLSLTLPPSAVTTGMRIKQGHRWSPGVLLDKKEAASTYEHYTSQGALAASGPALLSWEEEGLQTLRLFPIAPRGTASIEIEMKVPTCYQDGLRIALYPQVEEDSELEPARLRLAKGVRGRIVKGLGKLDPETRKAVQECEQQEVLQALDYIDDHWVIIVESAPSEAVNVRFGGHALGAHRSIGEFFVELAPRLEAAPRNAALVFVLDASLSQSASQLKDQLTLIEGYLAHVPDARFQIVVARRRARALFASFQSAARAPQLLRALRQQLPARGNGSNLDVATALAARLLAPFDGSSQRIVAFTDSRLRQSLVGEALEAAVASTPSVLVHVVDTTDGSSEAKFQRTDDHLLASAVMATGGMVVSILGGGNVATARAAMLGLVRPTQIDAVVVDHGGVWQGIAELPEVLPEGYGYRAMAVLDGTPEPITVRGKIWGRDVSFEAGHDSDASLRIPALAFGRDLLSALTSNELRALAKVGHVVSPATSLLARNPTRGPSSYDYEGGALISGTSMSSSSHSSHCGGVGRMSGYGTIGPRVEEAIDYGAALAGLLKGRAATCATMHQPVESHLSLHVETTGAEIVDVLPGTFSPYARCVVEAAWELRLGEFFARHEGRVSVSL